MKPDDKKTTAVPAVEKALDILEYIAQRGTSVTVRDIVTHLNIPLATAYRTVNYLCARQYLKANPAAESEYSLGPQLLYLAHFITYQVDLLVEAEPIMKELAIHTGQTAQLGILQEGGVMYIQQKLPSRPVNIMAALRTVMPVNVSASGKVLVAYLSPEERESFLRDSPMAHNTPNSITEIDALSRELERVRAQGYALDHEEYARGIGCAAAPIYDHKQVVLAAVGITGAIASYTDESDRRELIALVKTAAARISERLGAVPKVNGHSAGDANGSGR